MLIGDQLGNGWNWLHRQQAGAGRKLQRRGSLVQAASRSHRIGYRRYAIHNLATYPGAGRRSVTRVRTKCNIMRRKAKTKAEVGVEEVGRQGRVK